MASTGVSTGKAGGQAGGGAAGPGGGRVDDIVRGELLSLTPQRVEFGIPGTEYRLHLSPGAQPSAFVLDRGGKLQGRIEGKALRMFRASAGGKFIEPIEGAPRIVQGGVVAVDAANNRVLLDTAVPMWVTPQEGQSASDFQVGELLNFYMESGTKLVPT
jgi:hypothetical protein